MSANDGGDPVVLGKEPVERPPVIPRGRLKVERYLQPGERIPAFISFTVAVGGFDLTYTDIPTFTPANPDGSIEVLVSDHAVVTWEKVDAQ